MKLRIVPCGTLKVKAVEMIKPLSLKEIRSRYEVDREGNMRLAMNALLVEEGESKILMDPGTCVVTGKPASYRVLFAKAY